jgi:hypothetical protein
LKSSSEPEPRAAANHRGTAVRAAAAALPRRTSTTVVLMMDFHRTWPEWDGNADAGAEGEWRRWTPVGSVEVKTTAKVVAEPETKYRGGN